MIQVKPIETLYKGYRFRSRLEARWAVFFDALGIKWEYEVEGYDLGEIGHYLPDFWLPFLPQWRYDYPGSGAFLEVKGQYPTQREIDKLLHLSMATKHNGILVWGLPGTDETIWTHNSGKWGHTHSAENGIGRNPEDGYQLGIQITLDRMTPERMLWRGEHAFIAARSARFEHGESGAL